MKSQKVPCRCAKPRPEPEQLVISHIPLVNAIAAGVRRKLPIQVELDDLVQAGSLGLIDAARKFDARKKVPFESYAKYRIRGAILDSLRQADWASRDLRRRQKQIETASRTLGAELGRTPTDCEIAERLGINVNRLRKLMTDGRALARKCEVGWSDPDACREAAEDPYKQPDHLCARSRLREILGGAMAFLPRRSRKMIRLYYAGELTMREIGDIFGVNESRVSQIHKRSLELLASRLRSSGIDSSSAF
jgi:RNA polymerase sigma factor FliA